MNAVTSFSFLPLQIATYLGILVSIASVIAIIVVVVLRFVIGVGFLVGQTTTLLAILLLPAPARALEDIDEGPHPAVAAFDLALLRPFGFAATVIGAILFVPAALVTSPGGFDRMGEALELFVLVPGKNVFRRPIGEL